MSVILKAVNYEDVAPFIKELYRKSANQDPLGPDTSLVGVFRNLELQGYFAINTYPDGTLEIQQGYLKPEAQHKQLSRLAMKLLEKESRRLGFKRIILQTCRSFRAYGKFMDGLGFKPQVAVYSKQI